MSGGVDSSVAASLLLRAGCEVTGVFLCLGGAGEADGAPRGCCSPADAADARRVAGALGIDLHVLNLADAFGPIVDDFVGEYVRGRTPNPCIHCNSRIKFGRLIELADSLGIECVATGHYARVWAGSQAKRGQATFPVPVCPEVWNVRGKSSLSPFRPAIYRALARDKDQSYALFAVAREVLGRIRLPIGEQADKAFVRRIARELGLIVHDKPDSQEVCFVPDDDYVALLAERGPEALRAGEIVDSAGKVLGEHAGYGRFTIGQRRGLRVAAGVPMYVTAIDPAAARVTIGPRDECLSRGLRASGANWHGEVAGSFDAIVQIRYNHRGQAGRVRITGAETFEVLFAEPAFAVTPGQAAVVYDGERLLGGGWIDAAEKGTGNFSGAQMSGRAACPPEK